jgi:hypothetical protein
LIPVHCTCNVCSICFTSCARTCLILFPS